jgi:hypothetical protein
MGLIHAVLLDRWASTNIARDTLGELLRRLIYANVGLPSIKYIRFLAHEANQLSGWDGILECLSEVPWLPSGTSIWELGSGNNARQKIRDDFTDRREKELPAGWEQLTTTYVAVTLRKLDDISGLENELKADSPWKDVRIIDAQSLEEWIEISPSVEIWLQEQGIGPPSSVHTLSRVWSNWSEKTNPPVSIKLILAGRDQVSNDLLGNLTSQGSPINIQADSPEEAVAFVYSVIASSEEALFREHFLAKSIVIKQKGDTLRFQYDSSPENIILCPPATSESLALARSGHTVINALGNKSLAQRIDIRLTRPLRSNFSNALVAMGMSKENADISARACGSSPSIWRLWNLIEFGDLGDDTPDWAKEEYAHLIVPAVLIGGWSEKSEGDKEILEEITGKSFKEYRDGLNLLLCRDNPPLVKAGDAWVVSAPATAFVLTIPFITQGYLEKLSTIAKDVFGETDPVIDLPPTERPYAGIRDVHLKHSAWLRDGIAETLLRIAVIGERLERNGIIPGNLSCQQYVDSIIRELIGLREDWRLLASLRDQLPVLAEAAPVPFVEALECLLQGKPESLIPLFEEGDDLLFGHSFHTGLLWTLEMLAWETNYLGRVVTILAQLAKIDPGGKTANRPINSIREILLAWHPGTSATLDQRLQALDLLLERVPEIGWKLLIELMPKGHGETAFPTQEPVWRDFGRSKKEILTNKIVRDAYKNIVDRTIAHAKLVPSRWQELMGFYDDVSDDHRDAIEKGLRLLERSDLSEENRTSLWEALRELISKHREYPDASWALNDEHIKRLESVMTLFSPTDDVDRFSWLFNEYSPDVPFPRGDHDKYDEEIRKRRRDAIGYLWNKGGIDSIKKFLNRISFPGSVASYVFDFFKDETDAIRIFEDTSQGSIGEKVFARCLSLQAYLKFGESWTGLLIAKARELSWPSQTLANAFLDYPDSRKTFDLINSLGEDIDQAYWNSRENWLRMENDKEYLSFAIEKFIRSGRAVDILAFASHYAGGLKPSLLFRLLDQALDELNKGKKPFSNFGYHIEKVFDKLRAREDVDESELARKEYLYLPLLTTSFEAKDLTLHKIIAKDPKFFIDVICDLYKGKSGPTKELEPSSQEKLRGESAWNLLRSWKYPPGTDEKGQVIKGSLKEWAIEARKLAAELDRTDVADLHIGHVVFYYPVDPTDLIWPHIEIRELIETVQSSKLEQGIEIEQFNSRGVVSKALFEGGKQERALAAKWRGWAEKMDSRWLRTKIMLERIAASWDAHADAEDQRTEKEKLRYG